MSLTQFQSVKLQILMELLGKVRDPESVDVKYITTTTEALAIYVLKVNKKED